MVKGYYHSIDTFGAVDGRGIRYVLFMSGCSLGCKFCHNPDTWEQGNKVITAAEILKDYKRYRPFYNASSGGITVSGGEPLLQADFVAELFELCRHEGIHTTLDTSGYGPPSGITTVVAHTDEVLFSIKAVNPLKHKMLTQQNNDVILTNLRTAAALASITIRYVVIPDLNDSYEDIEALGMLVNSLNKDVPVELLPYHTLGRQKWDSLGWSYQLDDVRDATPENINFVRSILTKQHINVL